MRPLKYGPKVSRTVLVILLAFVLSGCSGREDRSETSVPPDFYASSLAVCSLLETRELEAVSGFAYRDGVGELNPGFLKTPGITTCMWLSEQCNAGCDALGHPDKAYVGVIYAYAGETFDFLDSTLRRRGNEVGQTVRGVGDDAIWHDTVSELAVLSGDKLIFIQNNHFRQSSLFTPLEDRLTRSTRLAKIVLRRLRR